MLHRATSSPGVPPSVALRNDHRPPREVIRRAPKEALGGKGGPWIVPLHQIRCVPSWHGSGPMHIAGAGSVVIRRCWCRADGFHCGIPRSPNDRCSEQKDRRIPQLRYGVSEKLRRVAWPLI
jgi:hypothetical protein